MTRVLCRVESEGAVGWGESVAGEVPWYSGETPRTVLYALEEFILPEVFKADLSAPQDVDEKLAWIREHRMAKATVEMAVWDLFAKRAGKPLSVLLGGTRDRILCGVAIGIQPSIEALMDTIRRELEGGYQRVKLKIKPGLEVESACTTSAPRTTCPCGAEGCSRWASAGRTTCISRRYRISACPATSPRRRATSGQRSSMSRSPWIQTARCAFRPSQASA